MPRSMSHPFRLAVALLATALVQLPASVVHAEGKPNKEANDKSPKGDNEKADKDKGDMHPGDMHGGDAGMISAHLGDKDEDDDDNEGKKNEGKKNEGKPEKEHKKSAAEELFGDDNKDEPDPVRLEVHMKGERASARAKIEKILEGKPMTENLRKELERDALTTAKLLRIRSFARSAKDAAAITKVNALLGKEHERHAEFLVAFKAKVGGAK